MFALCEFGCKGSKLSNFTCLYNVIYLYKRGNNKGIISNNCQFVKILAQLLRGSSTFAPNNLH